MGLKLVNIKFTNPDGSVGYGTCPEQALDHWLSRGYVECSAEEARNAALGIEGPSAEDVANGLVLDETPGDDADRKADDSKKADAEGEGNDAKTSEEAAKATEGKDSTAGDDADSKADDKPARGGRR